jgi:hypothetical protein
MTSLFTQSRTICCQNIHAHSIKGVTFLLVRVWIVMFGGGSTKAPQKNLYSPKQEIITRCQILLEDLWTIWSCCLNVFYEYYHHIPSYSLRSIFINVFMVLFLSDNVIYEFLFLWLCILIVCLRMTTLTEVFPCFSLSCKANARVKPAKTGHGPHSS